MKLISDELPLYREAFFRLFYPSLCALCQRLLDLHEQALCRPCWEELQKSKFLPSEERIRIPLHHADEAWALFRFEDSVREVLHQIKFERRRALLKIFGEELARFFACRPQLASYQSLVPIPSDPARRLERQFNQAVVLARQIHRITGIPLRSKWLFKRRSTLPQSELGREARGLNLHRVFRLSPFERIQNRTVLLVDDIFTTGATFDEAARILKKEGASRIGCFALARSPSH